MEHRDLAAFGDRAGDIGEEKTTLSCCWIWDRTSGRAILADKGYDAKANRVIARARGIAPAIPFKSNAKERPAFFPKAPFRGRARIEQCFGKLKRFNCVALRCEKTECGFAAVVALASSFILIKSVHTD